MARPDGESSNALFETLENWEGILKTEKIGFQTDARATISEAPTHREKPSQKPATQRRSRKRSGPQLRGPSR